MADQTPGQIAYQTYATATGNLTHDGRQMPAWDDLGDRIRHAWNAAALANLPWYERSGLGMEGGGQAARRTVAGLVLQAFAPELARGADAEDTVARVRAALRGLPADGTVPVRAVLDALYGEDQQP